MRGTPSERFWAKVDKTAPNGCWEWTGKLTRSPRPSDPGGYGRFSITATLSAGAHRFAYEDLVAPIPDGLVIDHLCLNRKCVNPDHLEAVTPHENARRAHIPKRGVLIVTHCKHGHEYTSENTHWATRKDGRKTRQCIICKRQAMARFEARNPGRTREKREAS